MCGSGARWCARTDAIFDVSDVHVLDVEIDDQQRLVLTIESGQLGGGLPGVWCAGCWSRPSAPEAASCVLLWAGHAVAMAGADVAVPRSGAASRPRSWPGGPARALGSAAMTSQTRRSAEKLNNGKTRGHTRERQGSPARLPREQMTLSAPFARGGAKGLEPLTFSLRRHSFDQAQTSRDSRACGSRGCGLVPCWGTQGAHGEG